jgi:hypothetical protein
VYFIIYTDECMHNCKSVSQLHLFELKVCNSQLKCAVFDNLTVAQQKYTNFHDQNSIN